MSAQALSFVWGLSGVTSEERLALLWLANSSAQLGDPVCVEWIGMSDFMCCHYEHASSVVDGLIEKGMVEPGNDERETAHYLWIVYGGPLNNPCDWTAEPKTRSKRVSALIERDGPECSYCDCLPVAYEVDHFVPRAKGGPDTMDNLVLACGPCNRSKRDKLPGEFLRDNPKRFHALSTNLKCSQA